VKNGTAGFSTAALAGDITALAATYSGDANFAGCIEYHVYGGRFRASPSASAVTVVEIPDTGSVRIPIAMTPEGGLAGPVSFGCSGIPEGVSCGF